MLGHRFTDYIPTIAKNKSDFDRLLDIFLQLLTITSGDVSEALNWLNNVDRQYNLTSDDYGMGDFIEELKDKGYISDKTPDGSFEVTAKSEQKIRSGALEEIFGKLKKSKKGDHKTFFGGMGDETSTDKRDYQFGDTLEQISVTDSLRNAQINHGLDSF
ncbi:MAG: hypothetical protein AAF519_17880, partial [Bacteroidota bacterium]